MKKYDLLIFGATGFTGRYVLERLVQTIKKYDLSKIRWAVAARNLNQLKNNLNDIQLMYGINLEKVPVFKTDIQDVESLNNAFQTSTLVLNCVGPYSLLGESVLKSCLDSDAHYMDLSGEPLFLEKMHIKYNQLAQQKKISAVGSCGFDSIPSDIGISYLKQKFNGRMNQAEHYLQQWSEKKKFNYSTWRALVEGYKYRGQLKLIRKELFSKYKPYKWPVLLERKLFRRSDEFGYCVPFPGSDRSVVIRSQMHRYTHLNELPAQCEMYFSLSNFIDVIKLVALNFNLRLLSKSDWGSKLLLDYSNFFSYGIFEKNILPSQENLETNKFRLTLVGRGWPNDTKLFDEKNMSLCSAVTISGGDLAYIDTAKIAVITALTFLDKIQNNNLTYGVLTPAVAFDPNDIIPRLKQEGIHVDFISEYKSR